MMNLYGLIGFPLGHTFSPGYFREKFAIEEISDAEYRPFELENIDRFPELLKSMPQLRGLNVTAPHKQTVIKYLTRLHESARAIEAVNTIKIHEDGSTTGYNTDVYGFETSLKRFVNRIREERFTEETAPGLHLPTIAMSLHLPNKAEVRSHLGSMDTLVLGTGGASRAVCHVLKRNGVHFRTVSRTAGRGDLTYAELTPNVLGAYEMIVNTTPLGTFPNVDQLPEFPYAALERRHHLFDLVYNPEVTSFMKRGKERGAAVQNGLEMLHLQADRAWEIWQDDD